MLCLCSCSSWGWACRDPKHVEDNNVTYMFILKCALKLVEEIILMFRIVGLQALNKLYVSWVWVCILYYMCILLLLVRLFWLLYYFYLLGCKNVVFFGSYVRAWYYILPDHRPATYLVQRTTSCIAQSKAPEDGQNCCPKHVELNWIYQ